MNKKILIAQKVRDCQSFVKFIDQCLQDNLHFIQDTKIPPSKTYHYINTKHQEKVDPVQGDKTQTKEPSGTQIPPSRRDQTTGRGYYGHGGAIRQKKCLACGEPHPRYSCPLGQT